MPARNTSGNRLGAGSSGPRRFGSGNNRVSPVTRPNPYGSGSRNSSNNRFSGARANSNDRPVPSYMKGTGGTR